MEKLWKFYWDCGRQGNVEGVFIASEEDVQATIGQSVYFGEILGKHSDVSGTIDPGEITVLTDNQEAIKVLKKYIGMDISGYNPLHYLPDRKSVV